ncbi:MAG: hypothetical protein KL863_08925 [Rhizobium sp.]|nr:hypothetical protein [Rhizobium sp.]
MRDLEFGINAKDRTAPAFDSAEARAKRFNSQLDKTSSSYALAGTAAKAFAAAFTLAGIEQFGRIVRGVITEAADLVDLADKVGVAADDLQRLQWGFKLAGIEAGEVDGFADAMVEADRRGLYAGRTSRGHPEGQRCFTDGWRG